MQLIDRLKASTFLKNSSIVTIGMLIGRSTGVAREASILFFLGTSIAADSTVIVLAFPDLLQAIILGGALAGYLIPRLAESEKSRGEKSNLITLIQSVVFVACYGIVCMATAFFLLPQLTLLLAPGFSEDSLATLQSLIAITLWQIPLTACAGVLSTWLQYKESFIGISIVTPILNMATIACIYIASSNNDGLFIISYCVIVISILRTLILFSFCAATTNIRQVDRKITVEALSSMKSFIKMSLSDFSKAITASILFFVTPLLVRSFASYGDPGDVSIANFSMKLVEMPVGVIGTIVSVVLLPYISRRSTTNEQRQNNSCTKTLYFSIVACFPLIFILTYFGPTIATGLSLLQGRLNGTNEEIVATTSAWIWSIIPLVSIAAISTYAQAAKNLNIPLLAAAFSVAIKFGIGKYLMQSGGLHSMVVGFVVADYMAFILIGYLYYRSPNSIAALPQVAGGIFLLGAAWTITGEVALKLHAMGVASLGLIATSLTIGLTSTFFCIKKMNKLLIYTGTH